MLDVARAWLPFFASHYRHALADSSVSSLLLLSCCRLPLLLLLLLLRGKTQDARYLA